MFSFHMGRTWSSFYFPWNRTRPNQHHYHHQQQNTEQEKARSYNSTVREITCDGLKPPLKIYQRPKPGDCQPTLYFCLFSIKTLMHSKNTLKKQQQQTKQTNKKSLCHIKILLGKEESEISQLFYIQISNGLTHFLCPSATKSLSLALPLRSWNGLNGWRYSIVHKHISQSHLFHFPSFLAYPGNTRT